MTSRSPLIDSKQISVVVQGPILPKITAQGLESIRRFFPDAQIILSTWKNADVQNLTFDSLVLNEDPGPIKTQAWRGSNLNRQIWSTRQGLKKVERPFCLKFRSDMQFKGTRLLNYWARFSAYNTEYKIFNERVIICTKVTYSTARFWPGLYHPSDMIGFGRTEDILRWWQIPLYPFENRSQFESEPVLISDCPDHIPLDELVPEQYIWLSSIRRSKDIILTRNPSREDLKQDLQFLLNNFVVVEMERMDIKKLSPEELTFGPDRRLLGFSEYVYLYRKIFEKRQIQMLPVSIFRKQVLTIVAQLAPEPLKVLWRFYVKLREALRSFGA